jgi:hypothetical protein
MHPMANPRNGPGWLAGRVGLIVDEDFRAALRNAAQVEPSRQIRPS